MKKILFFLFISMTLTACSLNPFQTEEGKDEVPATAPGEEGGEDGNEASAPDQEGKDTNPKNEDLVLEDGTVIVGEPESLEVVVNKERKLPEGYIPGDLTVPNVPFSFTEDHPKKQMREEAAHYLEELFKAAEADGLELVAASGYRSYERQKAIYERNVEVYGKEETDTFSAEPGTSEHQTGLAMDVTSAQVAFKLEQSFGETTEGEWLAEHAHEHGFIIRYREGSKDITGYMYEPWHLRYVGENLSSDVHEQQVTLEEFFGLHPSNE